MVLWLGVFFVCGMMYGDGVELFAVTRLCV